MSSPDRLTVTVPEAAHQLGICVRLAYDLARSGELPARRLGRRWVIPVSALNDYLGGTRVLPETGDRS